MDEVQETAPIVEPAPQTEGEEPKDRTGEQFEKLTDSNKQLKQENDALKDVIASLTPDPVVEPVVEVPKAQGFQNLSQGEIDTVYKSLIDEQGYLDGNKLMQTLQTMDQRVRQAEEVSERVAKQAEAERVAKEEEYRSKEVIELHDKYPTLDPKHPDFDKGFYDLVRNEMIGQLMEGKQDPMAAADKWASQTNMTKKEETEKQTETETAKRNINSTMPRSTVTRGYYDDSEADTLRQGIISGKKGALAELLRRREQGKA